MAKGSTGIAIVGLTLASYLAGCGGTPQPAVDPATSQPPLRLAVADVAIEDGYSPLPEANFIDERRSRELADAARRLLERRFASDGGPGWARVTIREAKLTERLMPDRQGGVAGLVTREPTWQLEADVGVRVTVLDELGTERAYADTSVGRTRSVRAGASVVDRDNAAKELMHDVLVQLDQALEKSVRENLASWLATY